MAFTCNNIELEQQGKSRSRNDRRSDETKEKNKEIKGMRSSEALGSDRIDLKQQGKSKSKSDRESYEK